MIRHETPLEAAHALVRHVPKRMSSLLEPAVGTGLLLAPLHRLCRESLDRIVCIDTDAQALAKVEAQFAGIGKRFDPICADFLKWSAPRMDSKPRELFDCVLMNPPFGGRRENFV